MKPMRGVVIVLTGLAAGTAVFYAATQNPLNWGRLFVALAIAIAGIFIVAVTGDTK